ncbi:MAG: anti-sigma factor [Stigonema ocellatum SAG 48.90 = DSM 106950]|nr:anti-sigma factor [Stigonema ocellatum SAG 48.90 = DSM 106950]
MTRFSSPEYLKELVAGYVVGDLDPEEAEEFKLRLAENPELAKEVKDLQEVMGQVLCGFNEVAPPQHLRSAILKATDIPSHSTPVLKLSSLPWRTIVSSVAALLVLVLGLDNYRLRQDLKVAKNVTTLLQSSQTRLFSLKGAEIANTASGNIVMNTQQQKIVIFIHNLPAPPQGHIYRLWAIVDNNKVPCGQLRFSPQGIVLDKLPIPSDLYEEMSGLIVTLEPSSANPEPIGPVVMTSMI